MALTKASKAMPRGGAEWEQTLRCPGGGCRAQGLQGALPTATLGGTHSQGSVAFISVSQAKPLSVWLWGQGHRARAAGRRSLH